MAGAAAIKAPSPPIFHSRCRFGDSADDVSYYAAFKTKSGTIYFQPQDGHKNYRFVIDYGDNADVYIDDAIVEKGCEREMGTLSPPGETAPDLPDGEYMQEWVRYNQFALNEDAAKTIEFTSEKGALIIQEK